MTATDDLSGKTPRDRSPSFPFISLKAAIARLVEFDAKFGRQEPTADRVYLAWDMKGNTSQAQQTVAALKSFGLLEYKGLGPKRPVAISDAGRKFLRAQQESVKKEVLKQIALNPKWIAHFWGKWSADKVPDEIRLDTLVLEHKFNENTAPTFLKVYDETIAFAGLSNSDKIEASEAEDDLENDEDSESDAITDPKGGNVAPPRQKEIKIMAGERELTTGLLSKDASFRLIVTGKIGAKEMDRLIAKLQLDKEILAEPDEDSEELKQMLDS